MSAALALVAYASAAQTEPAQTERAPSTAARAPPPSVDIFVIGEAKQLDALTARVASWFARDGNAVRAQRMPALSSSALLAASHRPGVRIWIVFVGPELLRVFYAVQDEAEANPRYLVEDTPLTSQLDEVESEQVAQTAFLSGTALWEGRLESPRAEIEAKLGQEALEPLAPPVPAPRAALPAPHHTAESSWHAKPQLGVDYAVRFRGPQGIAHGPGASAGERWTRRRLELGGALRAQLLLPESSQASGIELAFSGAAFSVGVSSVFALSERWGLGAVLDTGIDVIQRHAVSVSDSSLRQSSSHVELSPNTTLTTGVRLKLGGIAVLLSARVTTQWLRFHYDVVEPRGHSELLTPWRVQPGFCGGVQW
ncbi:MAG: hypothetical protein ABJB12_17195 [Pseudomonadota bacterium]